MVDDLTFENIFSVPRQERQMRSFPLQRRPDQSAGFVYQSFCAITVVDVPGDGDLEVVGNADQAAVEHPVRRAG